MCNSKSPDFRKVEIGMSKAEVVEVLGNNYNVVSAKAYEDGTLEIIEYFIAVGDSTPPAKYNWFFFFNNKLNEWGRRKTTSQIIISGIT